MSVKEVPCAIRESLSLDATRRESESDADADAADAADALDGADSSNKTR